MANGRTGLTKQFKFKILLYKAYFDKGMATTSYFKYLIAFFGLASRDIFWTMTIAISYAIICFLIGLFWFKWGFTEIETEIGNRFNPFVKEMRKRKI